MMKKIKLPFLMLYILIFSLISCSTTSEPEEKTCGYTTKHSE
ncbi:hypothetical protein [Borrelia miyamotoi]|nr:hypothetical protein [Borrelia miyamotoi]WVI04706.1 hypothetical protein F9Y91_06825 [Borrelia miyamotoi]